MEYFFDLEQHQGYERLRGINRQNVKSLMGKRVIIAYNYDPYRGYFSTMSGIVTSVRYNIVYLDNYDREIHVRRIKELIFKNNEQ